MSRLQKDETKNAWKRYLPSALEFPTQRQDTHLMPGDVLEFVERRRTRYYRQLCKIAAQPWGAKALELAEPTCHRNPKVVVFEAPTVRTARPSPHAKTPLVAANHHSREEK